MEGCISKMPLLGTRCSPRIMMVAAGGRGTGIEQQESSIRNQQGANSWNQASTKYILYIPAITQLNSTTHTYHLDQNSKSSAAAQLFWGTAYETVPSLLRLPIGCRRRVAVDGYHKDVGRPAPPWPGVGTFNSGKHRNQPKPSEIKSSGRGTIGLLIFTRT